MSLPKPLATFCLAVLMSACTLAKSPPLASPTRDEATIAFGSCLRQWQPQPVWHSIQALSPQAFVFLGDNMYADTGDYLQQPDPQRIENAYRDLAATPEFQAFRTTAEQRDIPLFATWDDHDYGADDGGADYPHRLASKGYFLDFFNIQQTAAGDSSQPGIYQSHRLQLSGLDVQLILLDTRSFRSPLKIDPDDQACPKTHIVANTDPDATVLGEAQWRWLEQQLRQPADMRLIASSIQVIAEQHCFEKWANFPKERQRLFDLIRQTKAEGVILLSGDRHHGEFSVLPPAEIGYPLYEITSSGLNAAMGKVGFLFGEQNRYRIDDSLFDNHFGTLTVKTLSGKKRMHDHLLEMRLYREDGELARQLQVPLSTLEFQQ